MLLIESERWEGKLLRWNATVAKSANVLLFTQSAEKEEIVGEEDENRQTFTGQKCFEREV